MKPSSLAAGIAAILTAASFGVGCSQSSADDGAAGQDSNITQGDGTPSGDRAEPRLVGDPIGGLLYGTYTSTEGQIAELTLKVSNPVVFVRVDRVDPKCKGDACETRRLTGVWDQAHYEGSLTKVIRFYGGDFELMDQFAYQRDGDSLTLTYDGNGTELRWKDAPRSGEGGYCHAGDKSRSCADKLDCKDDVCVGF